MLSKQTNKKPHKFVCEIKDNYYNFNFIISYFLNLINIKPIDCYNKRLKLLWEMTILFIYFYCV